MYHTSKFFAWSARVLIVIAAVFSALLPDHNDLPRSSPISGELLRNRPLQGSTLSIAGSGFAFGLGTRVIAKFP